MSISHMPRSLFNIVVQALLTDWCLDIVCRLKLQEFMAFEAPSVQASLRSSDPTEGLPHVYSGCDSKPESGLWTRDYVQAARAPPQIADTPSASASTTFSRNSFSLRWCIDHFSTLYEASHEYNVVESPTFKSGSGNNDTSWQLKICISPSKHESGGSTKVLHVRAGPLASLSLLPQRSVRAVLQYIGGVTTQRSSLGSLVAKPTSPAAITVECSLSVLGEDNSILKTTGKACAVLKVGQKITMDLFEQKEHINKYIKEGRLTVQCQITTMHHQNPIHSHN